MTAMAIGNEIYLSSSLIGTNSFTYKLPDIHPLRAALNKCEEALLEEWDRAGADTSNNRPGWSKHMRQAACGEQMTLLMYFEKYSNDMEKARDALKDAHIITVRSETLSDAKERGSGVSPGTEAFDIRYDKIIRFDPCGTSNVDEVPPSRFGCFQTVNQFGITFYREEADDYRSFDKDFQLKGGEFKTEQIGISC